MYYIHVHLKALINHSLNAPINAKKIQILRQLKEDIIYTYLTNVHLNNPDCFACSFPVKTVPVNHCLM